MQWDNTAVEVGIHVVLFELDKTRNRAIDERAKGLAHTDQTSNEFGVTDTRLRGTNNQRPFRSMGVLKDLVDSLDFNKVTEGSTSAMRFDKTAQILINSKSRSDRTRLTRSEKATILPSREVRSAWRSVP